MCHNYSGCTKSMSLSYLTWSLEQSYFNNCLQYEVHVLILATPHLEQALPINIDNTLCSTFATTADTTLLSIFATDTYIALWCICHDTTDSGF